MPSLLQAFDPLAPDAALLDRFRRERDGAAFAQLVRRHGPLVLGVCRRVTGDVHLADDAFQATWLVLARKPQAAADLRGFLYGVAVNVSRRARGRQHRRRRRETPTAVVEVAQTPHRPDPDELRLVGEAVGRLPEHLRAAVVLCELDGLSRKDAAARLGIPEGTLSSRLGKARVLLARDLSRRGVGLTTLGAAGGGVAVSPALAAAAVAFGTGGPAAVGVSALAGVAMRGTLLGRVLLAVGLTAGLAGGVAAWPATLPPADDPKPAAAKPKPKPADPGRLFLFNGPDEGFAFLEPAGKLVAKPTFRHPDDRILTLPAVSPDRGWVVFCVNEEDPRFLGDHIYPRSHIMLFPADGGAGKKLPANPCDGVFWLPSGELVVSERFETADTAERGFRTCRMNVHSGLRTPLALPDWFLPESVAADGRTFVGLRVDFVAKTSAVWRVELSGLAEELCPEESGGQTRARISPDGKRVLFADWDAAARRRRLVVTAGGGTKQRVAGVSDDASLIGHCWAPDGKRLAYVWWKVPSGTPVDTRTEQFLTVADADGGNARNIRSAVAETVNSAVICEVDWR